MREKEGKSKIIHYKACHQHPRTVINMEHGVNVKQTHPKLDQQKRHDDFLHPLHQMAACKQCVSIQLQN